MSKWINATQASLRCGAHRSTIVAALKRGDIEGRTIETGAGTWWEINPKSLDEWAQERYQGNSGKNWSRGEDLIAAAVHLPVALRAVFLNRSPQSIKNRAARLRKTSPYLFLSRPESVLSEKEMLSQLGKESDILLARKAGVTPAFIRALRTDRGIPAWTGGTKCLPWDDIIKLLGTQPDNLVAEMAGCSGGYIQVARRRLGIEPYRKIERRKKGLAQKKLEPYLSVLGKKSDLEISRLAHVCVGTVQAEREKRSIPPFRKTPNIKWSLWDHLLGEVPDSVIAKKAGIATCTVAARRAKHKITAYTKKLKSSPPTE